MPTKSWHDSYFGQLRALAGDRTLLLVGAQMLLRDPGRGLLLIRRRDSGYWTAPAGGMEIGESIEDCAVRELREETGLQARTLTPFALYTGPDRIRRNRFGHTYQHLVMYFRVDKWHGELVRTTEETVDAGFFPESAPPEPLAVDLLEVLADLALFESSGHLVLK